MAKNTKTLDTGEMKIKLLAELGKQDGAGDDVIYPAELNDHLIEQLKVLTGENDELRKLVYSKESEIKEQCKMISDLQQRIRDVISGSGPAISSKSAGVISAKITELCKQNRHLVAELEGQKSKKAVLERKVMDLELMLKEKDHLNVCVCKDEPIEMNPDELKELNKQLASVNKKLHETKNKNVELKNDILIATKILQQELGDKFTNIKDLYNDIAGWRGRAQEIRILKQKVAELEEKLNIQKKEECKSKIKEYSPNEAIKDIAEKKKKELFQTVKENEELKQSYQEIKKKLEAAKCRMKSLECEVTMIKQKMQTLAEKSKNDDTLIEEQRNQIKAIELFYQDILKENTKKMNRLQSDIDEYKTQFANTDEKICALRLQANEKAIKIDELRAQLLRYEECSLQNVFFTPMKTATDNEIKTLSHLVQSLNERLDNERHNNEEVESQNRTLKEKKKALILERKRLLRRLSLMEEEASMSSAVKGDARRTSTTRSSFKKESQSSRRRSTQSSTEYSVEDDEVDIENLGPEGLKFKLELTEEKLKILEDKLKMVEEEKAEDITHLMNMIQTSKDLYTQALAVLQKEKCECAVSAKTVSAVEDTAFTT